jgi:sterol desaturase/sphingolipid hydroxylase (fatty acid hydroxylase superfamily)
MQNSWSRGRREHARTRGGEALNPRSSFATLALAAWVTLLFTLERIAPLRQRRAPFGRRLFVNASLSGLALAAAVAAVKPAAAVALRATSRSRLGLLQLAPASPALRGIASFLLLDLSFYYWHQLNHRVPLLWRFHNVHHVDPDLDVTTAARFHFGEIALSAGFRAVQILVIGPTLAAYLVYELAFQAGTLLHHSNVRLPISLERALNAVLVTPRMHGTHHSVLEEEDNSNFGVILSWWDRLHHTLLLNVPQSEITIGIAGYCRRNDNGVRRALAMPFSHQRDYWTSPDGAPAKRRGPAPSPRSRMAE